VRKARSSIVRKALSERAPPLVTRPTWIALAADIVLLLVLP